MTLTQLEYIVALEKYKNFNLAAKACHISQPTLSVQVQKIEDLLQVTIFDRSKIPVIPTLLGKKIIDAARNVLSNVKSIEQLVADEKGSVAGDFKLAIIPSVTSGLIPLFLRKFTDDFPEVKLTIIEMKTEDLIEALKKDEIDAAIAATPLNDNDLSEYPLYWEPFYLFVNPQHELFAKEKVSKNELNKYNILLMSEGNCIRTQVGQICQLNEDFIDDKKNIEFDSGNFQTLIQLVKQNMGITLLPHLEMTTTQAQKGMIKSFKGKIPLREIALITRRTMVKKTITDALNEIIKEVVPRQLLKLNKTNSNIINPI